MSIISQGSVWADHAQAKFPCLDGTTGEVKKVLVPRLLLQTAIALLSFHRADVTPTPELQVCFDAGIACWCVVGSRLIAGVTRRVLCVGITKDGMRHIAFGWCSWTSEVSRRGTVRGDRACFFESYGGLCLLLGRRALPLPLLFPRFDDLWAALRNVAVVFARCQSCMHLENDLSTAVIS